MTAALTKRDLRELRAKGCTIGPLPKLPAPVRPNPPCPTATAQATAGRSWTLRIPGWHPVPLNKIMRGHWSNGHRAKKADAERIAVEVMMGGIPPATSKRTVRLHVVWAPGQRTTDKDSHAKSLLDALQLAGAIKNDSAAWVNFPEPTYSRGEELVSFVTIEE